MMKLIKLRGLFKERNCFLINSDRIVNDTRCDVQELWQFRQSITATTVAKHNNPYPDQSAL